MKTITSRIALLTIFFSCFIPSLNASDQFRQYFSGKSPDLVAKITLSNGEQFLYAKLVDQTNGWIEITAKYKGSTDSDTLKKIPEGEAYWINSAQIVYLEIKAVAKE